VGQAAKNQYPENCEVVLFLYFNKNKGYKLGDSSYWNDGVEEFLTIYFYFRAYSQYFSIPTIHTGGTNKVSLEAISK
jgi:hypothetical protein